MNKDKVYLEGYVVGHAADTLGCKGLLVQLGNLEIVEIDKDLVHKNINEPQPIKLKDVIARIGEFNLATKAVWINEILNKLGSDYGTLKYKDGYEQGKGEGLIEREKVTIPQFVADWYEKNKNNLDYNIWNYVSEWENQEEDEFKNWFNHSNKAFQTLVNMHQFGYTVEKEKRYTVKIKAVDQYLVSVKDEKFLGFLQSRLRSKFTQKELEDADFGWVFDCPGIEIEEVEE